MSNKKNENIDRLKPPTFFIAATKRKYSETMKMLKESGDWRDGDEIALTALFTHYQRWFQAEQLIKKNKDLCFTTKTGYRQQIPEISISNNSMAAMLSYIKEFGLSPKERNAFISNLKNGAIDHELERMISK